MCRYRRSCAGTDAAAVSRQLRYWKPIQTGVPPDDDTAMVKTLAACRDEELLEDGVRLLQPVSPHLAARLSGTVIDVRTLETLASAQPRSDRWIVEGAGGVLVPVNDETLMVDLMAELSLPVVVVARTTLGTINHTLLTIEALRRRALTVAGVVLAGDSNPETRAAIEDYGRVTVVGELPPLVPLTPGTVARQAEALDPGGRLEDLFA
jgi:dethiobiotin synthase